MKRQRGSAVLDFLLANWQLIALGLLIATAYGFYLHCQSVKQDFDTFKAEVKVKGEEQERLTRETIARNQKEKERADEVYKRNLARLERDVKRLRDSTGTSILPAPSSAARSPETACFSRADLDRALNQFIGDVTGLVREGDEALIGLDTARTWAQGR